jgi:allophanate hydrolase
MGKLLNGRVERHDIKLLPIRRAARSVALLTRRVVAWRQEDLMIWDELTGSLDFTSLRSSYASGAIRPEDVIHAVYRRIAARGDDHVWIHLVPEEEALAAARRVASTMPPSAPLFGLPCAIKDNIDVPGLPSTSAFPPSRRIATNTGPAVRRLLDAGAIVIGKTNMDQLAIGLVGVRSPYGAARNAFNRAFIPGGSSAGSGVAVGAGLVSFALGNDAAGSGRVPAAFNNVVGVKPTPGLVSNTAVVGGGTAKSLETISVFALTVDDGMAVLRLIAGYDPDDLFSKTEARYCDLSPQSLPQRVRFAVPRARDFVFFGDSDAELLFEAAIARLEKLGGVAVEIDYEVFMEAQRLLYEAPFLAERNVSIAPMTVGHEDALHPVTRAVLETATAWSAQDTFRAIHRLAELKRDARRALAGTDVLLLPTTPTIYRIEEVEADPIVLNARLGTYTNFVNLMGLCAIAVPNGFRADGLPLGVTVIADGFADAKAAAVAAAFHRATGLTLGAGGTAHPC